MNTYHSQSVQSAFLLLLFVFCQVIGTMCVIPDVAITSEVPALIEEMMACPMEGATMCPPSLTSSPERQFKTSATIDIFDMPVVLHPVLNVVSVSARWSWSSVLSIVPLSIVASSVLRI